MNVLVDAAVYMWPGRFGISRVFREILPRVCDLDPAIRIRLCTDGVARQALPAHPRIDEYPPRPVWRALGHGRAARRLAPSLGAASQWLAARTRRAAIWHSTFFTRPRYGAAAEVVTIHDMIHERFADVFSGPAHDDFRARKRDCIANADVVVCVSEATRADLEAYGPRPRGEVHVIPHSHSAAFRKHPSGPAPAGRPFVLYVGDRRGHHKGFATLLDAVAAWSPQSDIELLVAGVPWQDDERRELVRRGMVSRVRLVVDPDDATLARLYNDATMFVYPSLWEGFGIPLLEALACGCPVVASRIPSTLEVAGDCAIYFEPGDHHSLVGALDAGLGVRAAGLRAEAGLERVRRYSWEGAAAQTVAAYRAALAIAGQPETR